MRARHLRFITLMLLVSVLFLQAAEAIPPLPHEFHGIIVIGERYAPEGTLVQIWDSTGALCGGFELEEPGFYGYLSCRGDDPSTTVDEGPSPGEKIVFSVDGEFINTTRMEWRSGTFTEVNLLLGPESSMELIYSPARVTTDVGSTLDTILVSMGVLALVTLMVSVLIITSISNERREEP